MDIVFNNEFDFSEDYAKFIKVFNNNDDRKPFKYATFIVKKDLQFTIFDVKGFHQTICRIFDEKKLNFGLLMLGKIFIVFTEEQVILDRVMLKLAENINVYDQVEVTLPRSYRKLNSE